MQARNHPFFTNETFDPDWQPKPHQELMDKYIEENKCNLANKKNIFEDLPATNDTSRESYRPIIPQDKKNELSVQS